MYKSDYLVIGNSKQGFSHKCKEKKEQKLFPCEDSHTLWASFDSSFYVAIVADGHGSSSCFRSNIGSKLAVNIALEKIKIFVPAFEDKNSEILKNNYLNKKILTGVSPKVLIDENDGISVTEFNGEYQTLEKDIRSLEASIVNEWFDAVESHYNHNPFDNEEKVIFNEDKDKNIYHVYGTTLIATVISKNFWLAIHIGDGKCCALFDDDMGDVRDQNFPIPWDKRCFRNITTSICDSDSYNEFRHCLGFYHPIAIIAASDGIDDSFSIENNNQKVFNYYNKLLKYIAHVTEAKRHVQLGKVLDTLSQKGSGDDVTVAAIVNKEYFDDLSSQFSHLLFAKPTRKRRSHQNLLKKK